MSSELQWLGRATCDDGTVERSFVLHRPTGGVPGILWPARDGSTAPVVLLGHGGSGHKRSARTVRLARWFASAGIATVAIDGPYHGDRVPCPLTSEAYQQMIAAEGIGTVIDRMTDDWLDTISALGAGDLLSQARVAVLGMSMGARFGLPVAASLGPRLNCAVFGKFGLSHTASINAGLAAHDRVLVAARSITAPVRFHTPWHDEVFPRDGQLELFDALASTDKYLIARPGPHGATHTGDEVSWREFIASHLGRPSAGAGEE